MARPDTQDEQTILQNLWILASTLPEGADVPCGDASSAKRLRFSLYNAVKYFKGPDARPCSEQLKHAITTCSLSFSDCGTRILIRQKIATKLNQTVLGVLQGFDIKTEEERQADESSARVMSMLASSDPTPVQLPSDEKASMYGARSR